jgi:beta-glucosidase
LYIRDEFSSVTRPVKELKAFEKIQLALGESKTVTFKITSKELAFWTIDKKYDVESGTFLIKIGASSKEEDLQSIRLTVKE